MAIYSITEAKAQLSAIIQKVVEGEEDVIIGRAGTPLVKMTKYHGKRRARKLNLFRNQITVADDFDVWPDDIARSLGLLDQCR